MDSDLKEQHQDVVQGLIKYYLNSNKEEIIFICIGTPKLLGDSLGPCVGSKLLELNINTKVYGTLDDPIQALNLEDKVKYINEQHPDAFIIAIDACIGEDYDIGEVFFRNFSMEPGKGAGKKLISIGDVSIVGIVAEELFELLLDLVPQYLVDNLCNVITDNIVEFLNKLKDNKEIAINK